jgi:pimeloyl-ACP methyl ester carboxylesterase
MGGLIALHLALRRPDKVAGLVLLAPAVAFADRRWERLSLEQRQTLFNGGSISLNTEYKEDFVRWVNRGGHPRGLLAECRVAC